MNTTVAEKDTSYIKTVLPLWIQYITESSKKRVGHRLAPDDKFHYK